MDNNTFSSRSRNSRKAPEQIGLSGFEAPEIADCVRGGDASVYKIYDLVMRMNMSAAALGGAEVENMNAAEYATNAHSVETHAWQPSAGTNSYGGTAYDQKAA